VRRFLVSAFVLCCALPCAAAPTSTVVRRLTLLGAGDHVEIEIDASQPVTPKTLVVANPDRLVLDFPGAVPGKDLHALKIGRGRVKDIRVGLFTANPPTTRVVLDLAGPQPFQLFPSGRSVIVKMGSNAPAAISTISSSATTALKPSQMAIVKPAQAQPNVEVEFEDGELTIRTDHATLAEVLREVHRQTGAEIAIPPEAEQEQVIANYGPGPASQVMSALLNGSPFDFILVGAAHDPNRLTSILLTPRGSGPDSDSSFYPEVTNTPSNANARTAGDPAPDTAVGPDMQQPPQ
jgi:AMIN domain